MKTEILVAVIAAGPALFSPIVGWFVNRIGLGRRFREIDLRIKKLELLEKAASLSRTESAGHEQVTASIDKAISNTLAYLEVAEEIPTEQVRLGYASLSRTKRFFLLFKPYSIKGWVFRVLYYLNLYFIVVMPFMFFFLAQTGEFEKTELPLMIPGMSVYVILTIVFHRLAVSDARKHENHIKKPANHAN